MVAVSNSVTMYCITGPLPEVELEGACEEHEYEYAERWFGAKTQVVAAKSPDEAFRVFVKKHLIDAKTGQLAFWVCDMSSLGPLQVPDSFDSWEIDHIGEDKWTLHIGLPMDPELYPLNCCGEDAVGVNADIHIDGHIQNLDQPDPCLRIGWVHNR